MAITALVQEDSDALVGVEIVDCDAHWTEAPDLWTSRAPKSLLGRVPVLKTVDGITSWFIGDELWASMGGNSIGTNRSKVLGSASIQPFSEIDESAWVVSARLALMDDMGVRAQVLYPNGVGFASNHLFAIEDLDDRRAILEMYNDSLMDVQEESKGRLFPQAVLPIWDMDLTVREMARLIDRGARGFTLSDRPELLGLPDLGNAYFEPMWDVFSEARVATNFHVGAGSTRAEKEEIRSIINGYVDAPRAGVGAEIPKVAPMAWRSFGPQRALSLMGAQGYMSNVRIMANLCHSDLFDRFPRLRIVSVESGIGWVPFVLEGMDYNFAEMVVNPSEASAAKRLPSEYFHDHFYVMFWFETHGVAENIRRIGIKNVLVETDVPHPTCLYPGAREHFDKVLAGLTPQEQRRVLQDNGAQLYNISI
jgi:predicted TIM-barrel fold metal-dependent hydrolase